MQFFRQVLCVTCVLLGLSACSEKPPVFHATDITGASFGQHFSLPDTTGKARSLADFRGKAVVLFFGYTSCPDVCPTTLTHFSEVAKKLGDSAKQVQFLFVTLDPERDTSEKLGEYLRWFNPDFIGLRGGADETKKVTEAFRVFATRTNTPGAMGYVIDHSAGAYVFDPAGRLRLYVRDTAQTDDLVADLLLLFRS